MSDLGDLLRRAIELTPLEFSIEVDPHKANLETLADYIGHRDPEDLDEATWREILELGTVTRAGAYVNSVTQLVVYSADVETALRELVAALEAEAERRKAAGR